MLKLAVFSILTLIFSSCLFESGNNTILKEVYNDQKNMKAILFLKEGNAVTDESLQVSIVGSDYKIEESEVGNIFTTDSDHNSALLNSGSISLSWISNDTLQVAYNSEMRTFSKLKIMKGVVIVYKEVIDKRRLFDNPSQEPTWVKKSNIDKGHLSGKTVTLKVNYGGVACRCAQWTETKNAADTAAEREYFYLEQGKPGIINADTIFNGTNFPVQLLLSGQFYNKVGYPENFDPGKEEPGPARVFRYNKIKILQQ